MKTSQRHFIYTLLFFSTLIIVVGILGYFKDENLLQSHQLRNAIITDVVNIRNSGGKAFIKYKFSVKGVRYNVQESIDCNYSFNVLNFLKGREVSIIYHPEKPANSKLLLKFRDFSKYRVVATSYDSIIIHKLYEICN